LSEFVNINIVSPLNAEHAVGVVSCVLDGYGSDSIGQVLSNHRLTTKKSQKLSSLSGGNNFWQYLVITPLNI
jgi:hypothetical protein